MTKKHARPGSTNALSRRTLLTGLGATVGTSALGCGSSADESGETGDPEQQPPKGGPGGGKGDDPSSSCVGSGGLTGRELLAGIETIVVLCMENRSFDHFLGSLSLREGWSVDGLRGGESNPGPNGPVEIHQLNDYTPADPPHSWEDAHLQFGNGQNDGFVVAHAGPSENDVMGYHVRSQLPITYALADSFAVCDNYYCSVMGPTWPNRFYLHGGSSNGHQGNTPIPLFDNVWDWLDDIDVESRIYYHDVPWCSAAYQKVTDLSRISTFFEDAARGELRPYNLIDPQFFGSGANDDHPDHDIRLGQALIAAVYSALAKGPQWNKCLFVITYDEHGGFYDHVAPPKTADERPEFQQLGFRVPTILVGPTVRRGCVVSTQYDHASILKTVATRHGIEIPNVRIEAAKDLSACIQPKYLQSPKAAPALPKLEFSHSALESRRVVDGHHREIREAVESGRVPKHLDLRSTGLGQTEHVLEWGARLGALQIRR